MGSWLVAGPTREIERERVCVIRRRWNNTISLSLRTVIYDPIMEGRLFYDASLEVLSTKAGQGASTPGSSVDSAASASAGSTAGSSDSTARRQHVPLMTKALATAAIFAVSGLEHELVLWLVTQEGEYHGGWWFTFFFIQFPLIVAEGLLLKKLKASNIILPRLLRVCITTAVFMSTAYAFWYPPVETYSRLATRCVDAVNRNVMNLIAGLVGLGRQLELGASAYISNGSSAS